MADWLLFCLYCVWWRQKLFEQIKCADLMVNFCFYVLAFICLNFLSKPKLNLNKDINLKLNIFLFYSMFTFSCGTANVLLFIQLVFRTFVVMLMDFFFSLHPRCRRELLFQWIFGEKAICGEAVPHLGGCFFLSFCGFIGVKTAQRPLMSSSLYFVLWRPNGWCEC